MARGISINIGLNSVDPAQYDGWDGQLTACEFDAQDMALLAQQCGFEEPTVVLTEAATADNVLGLIGSAAQALEAGDILFLTYSGHGGQFPDDTGDESDDGQDETWVFYDRQVVDDELYAIYVTFQPGVRILVLSDSCHSGSVYRELPKLLQPAVLEQRYGGSDEQQVDRGTRAMPAPVQAADYRERRSLYDGIRATARMRSSEELSASLILISGCADNQLSGDGERNGAFTARLLDVWNNGKFSGNYVGFHKSIVAGMPPDQTPVLTATGPDGHAFASQGPFAI